MASTTATQPPRAAPAPSPWLKRAVEAVVSAYAAGRIEVAEAAFAENLLLECPPVCATSSSPT